MPRPLWIAGIALLAFALVFSFLASVSLPILPGLDIIRVNAGNGVSASSSGIFQIRFGVWARCEYVTNGDKICNVATGQGYVTTIESQVNHVNVTIGKSWTRGLAVHPVATGITFVALVLACFNRSTMALFASIVSFLAASLTLIAFAIDLALFAFVHHEIEKLGTQARTYTGRGFWLNFISLVLLMVAGFTVCFGRRRDRLSDASSSYPMSTGFKFTKK